MSAVESDSLPMGAPGSSLVAYMPHTGRKRRLSTVWSRIQDPVT